MQNNDAIEDNARRDFLKMGTLAAAATACGSLVCSCGKNDVAEESSKKVKLLSPDGEVVEVDEKHLREPSDIECITAKEARKGVPGRKFVMVVDLLAARMQGNVKQLVTRIITPVIKRNISKF